MYIFIIVKLSRPGYSKNNSQYLRQHATCRPLAVSSEARRFVLWFEPLHDRVVRESSTEAVDSGSLTGRIKPNAIKLVFKACRSAFKRESAKPPPYVVDRWQLDLKTELFPSMPQGQGN